MDGYGEIWDMVSAVAGDFHQVFDNSLRPNNEHRIFFTHWMNVGLFLVNHRSWDLLLEASVNAFLSGAIAFVLLTLFRQRYGPLQRLAFGFILAFCFAIPFAYENILWGFQSHHFFFILFSIIAIYYLICSPILSPAWLFGFLRSVAACFSLGSGFYAALAIVGASLVAWTRRDNWTREWLILALVCLLTVLANLPFIPKVPSELSCRGTPGR
jgi:hypothetical protein